MIRIIIIFENEARLAYIVFFGTIVSITFLPCTTVSTQDLPVTTTFLSIIDPRPAILKQLAFHIRSSLD